MAIRSAKEIYQILGEHLRKNDKPVTCADIMDIHAVRKAALAEYGDDVRLATDKVSDALGFMWRRGLLTRYPAPKDSRTLARFSYAWGTKQDAKTVAPVPPIPTKKTGPANGPCTAQSVPRD